MKIFGSISELVAAIFRKDSQAITLRPSQTTTYTGNRDIQLPAGDTAHVLVSRTSADTLTSKTIDGDDNTVQDLALTSLKTVLADANKMLHRNASGTVISGVVTESAAGAIAGATQLTVDNVDINGNAITSTTGALDLTGASSASLTGASGVLSLSSTTANVNISAASGAMNISTPIVNLKSPAGEDQPQLQLSEDPDSAGGNYIAMQAPASVASNRIWTFPDADGSEFVGTTAAQAISGKTQLTVDNIDINGNTIASTTGAMIITGTSTASLTAGTGNATLASTSGNVNINATAGGTNITLTAGASGDVNLVAGAFINAEANALTLKSTAGDAQPQLRLTEDPDSAGGTEYIAIQAPASVAANRTWTFPDADGAEFVGTTASQLLTNKTLTSPDINTQIRLLNQGQLQLREGTGGGTNQVNIQAPATLAADYTLTLPADDGTASQFLQTDGSGVLSWQTVSAGSTASPTVQGQVTSYFPTIQSAKLLTTNDDATMTTTDGYEIYLFSTGNTNRTFNLEAASANTGRRVIVKKVDTGTGRVNIDPNSTETVDGQTIRSIYFQYDWMEIACDGTEWFVVSRGWNQAPVTATFAFGTGWGTVTTQDIRVARAGNMAHIYGYFLCGTVSAAVASLILPTGYNIDSTYIPSATNLTEVGWYVNHQIGTSAVNSIGGALFYDGSSNDRVFFGYETSNGANANGAFVKNDANAFNNSNRNITVDLWVPISQFLM